MNAWLETGGVLLLGVVGVALGRWFSRLPKPHWTFGYFIPLALMKFAFLVDHYVAVLDVDDQTVTVGDPLNGRQTIAYAEFAKNWRFVGLVLRRNE